MFSPVYWDMTCKFIQKCVSDEYYLWTSPHWLGHSHVTFPFEIFQTSVHASTFLYPEKIMDDYELFPAFPFSDLLAVLFKYCSL